MSEPEKLYTLPEVLEIVKEHAGALFGAGAALEATEGEDPEMLAMVGERAERAQKQFWEFESENVLDEAAHAAWHERDENGEVSPLWHTLYALPLLPMGVEATAANPAGAIPGSAARFFWLHYHTERIAGVLMDWVDAHRKDLEPATATEENGVGAQPVSEPEEPQEPTKPESEQLMPTEAFEAMADALRPLAHGVRPLIAGADELSGCYIDQSSKPWKLTQQGEVPAH